MTNSAEQKNVDLTGQANLKRTIIGPGYDAILAVDTDMRTFVDPNSPNFDWGSQTFYDIAGQKQGLWTTPLITKQSGSTPFNNHNCFSFGTPAVVGADLHVLANGIPESFTIICCAVFKSSNLTALASYTGSISTTTLTASSVTGTISVGNYVAGTGVNSATTIVSQLTGTPGGAGTYQVSVSQTVGSVAMTSGNNFSRYLMSTYDPVANQFSYSLLIFRQGGTTGISFSLGNGVGGNSNNTTISAIPTDNLPHIFCVQYDHATTTSKIYVDNPTVPVATKTDHSGAVRTGPNYQLWPYSVFANGLFGWDNPASYAQVWNSAMDDTKRTAVFNGLKTLCGI